MMTLRLKLKYFHQQLAQAQEKQAALDSQISNLWELVQKQQEEFDSKILKFQTRDKELDQAREWGWAKELEKKKREWEREQKWEWEARSKRGVS